MICQKVNLLHGLPNKSKILDSSLKSKTDEGSKFAGSSEEANATTQCDPNVGPAPFPTIHERIKQIGIDVYVVN